MSADFTVKNDSNYPIKAFEIRCVHAAPLSGWFHALAILSVRKL